VYDRAEQDLLHALKLRPDLAELEVELGLLRYRQGRPAEALQVYEKVQKRRPHDPKLMVNMADAFAANHQRDKALEALRTAIEISPDFWEPHYLLGIEYASQNRLPDAVREFQTVVRLRPDFAQGHFNLGVALAKGGQLGPAAAEFERTVQLDPAHKSAAAYLAQLQKGAAK
jgi:tetratricopeptide (TPR) repeat protein